MTERTPPVAKREPVEITVHGDRRVDEYAWLRDPGYPDVTQPEILSYLEAENAYVESTLDSALRSKLFEELKARIKEDDSSVPYKWGPHWYQSRYRQGAQYPVYLRRDGAEDGPETLLLDLEAMAKGRDYLDVGDVEPRPTDHALFAYSVDDDGSERYTIRFREVATGNDLPDVVPGTAGDITWSADGTHVFYARLDENLRPSRIYRHRLGTDAADDVLVYEENDQAFWLSVYTTSDERYIVVHAHDKESSEIHVLPTDAPTQPLRVIVPRRPDHLYDIDHHDGVFYIRTNDAHRNFRLVRVAAEDPAETKWAEVLAPSDEVYLRGFRTFSKHLVCFEREAGLPQVRVRRIADGVEHRIAFPDPVYTVGQGMNAEFDATSLRLRYESLVHPATVLDYDLEARTQTIKKVQEIPSGYDADLYTSERRFALASDGTRVPVSIVHRKDVALGPDTPLYLYGYGSYGHSIDPYFSTARLSLLDRGFVFAIAHVRGGSELGRGWYEDGKLAKKRNTFTDFIACAEMLIADGYTGKGRITVAGGSAGGMLVGAVVNMRPELFGAGVAMVPFVDCLATMLDASLPLTPTEYSEWGNPEADPEAYATIKSYSPYDNVAAQAYPNLLVTAGLSDPRVTYWEPAKWVARLRHLSTGDALLLLHTNMGAGHAGASGRFDALEETALQYAFLLKVYSLAP